MEIIKKKICLEDSRSRKQGLLPFIPFNIPVEDEKHPFIIPNSENYPDGNWGGFVANFKIGDEYKHYKTMSYRYFKAMDIVKRGIKVKRVLKNGIQCLTLYKECDKQYNEFIQADIYNFTTNNDILYTPKKGVTVDGDYFNLVYNFSELLKYDNVNLDFCSEFESYIGKIIVPYTVTIDGKEVEIKGDLVPDYINACDVKEYYDWMYENEKSNDCCRKELWNRKGGKPMMVFLEENLTVFDDSAVTFETYVYDIDAAGVKTLKEGVIPTVDIPLLLTNDTSTIGTYNPYMEEDIDYDYKECKGEYDRDSSGYTAESKLSTLRDGDMFYDDEGNLLPGVFEWFKSEVIDIDKGTFFAYNQSSGRWEEAKYKPSKEEDYETVDFPALIPETADTESMFFVRYNNSETYPMRIPYQVNVPKNSEIISGETSDITMRGDFITEIKKDESAETITFTYVIGGKYIGELKESGSVSYIEFKEYIDDTGIKYQETYRYSKVKSDEFYYENNGKVTVYYEYIDYDSAKATVTNSDFGLTREAIISNILEYDKNDVICNDSIKTPLIMPDYLVGVTDEVKSKIDVTIYRGKSAAFERHFKLTECCSLEDLENYGNNYFNL